MSKQIVTHLVVDLDNRDKGSVLWRLILTFPFFLFVASFSIWANDNNQVLQYTGGVLIAPAALALIFRGVYPSYVLTFNKAYLSLSNRLASFVLCLTDQYPSIEENQKVKLDFPEIDGGKVLNRYAPLYKWFLAIPLYLLGALYFLYALILTLIAWFNILFTGHYPEASADGVVKVIAYWNRVYGYAILLVTDEYPSFSL
ncbi:MAG: DUF4389 domain-containing protein [Actinobacteria bacterium]|nr:DUF4389 domain-containing protein [Actinomycetota bacterium]